MNAIEKAKEVLVRNLRDLDMIDQLCDIGGHPRFDLMRKETTEALAALEVEKPFDLQDVIDDYHRLTKELDDALNGDDAAKAPSLCDVVAQVKNENWKLVKIEAEKPADEIHRYDCEIDYGMVENDLNGDYIKYEEAESYHAKKCAECKPSGWISVKDRLPPEETTVLIATCDWVIIGKYKPAWGDREPVFADDGDCGLFGQPTHWQPLPETPK